MEANDLVYCLLSARNAFRKDEIELRNKIYAAWLSVWKDVYGEGNADYKLVSDDFLRQDLISCILVGGEVAALHFYTFFDLHCAASRESKYFQFFNSDYLGALAKRKVQKVMSMEYFTVTPKFRKANLGFSIGYTIGQLGTHVFADTRVDAIIAPARNDLKVNQMAYDVGFTCIVPETIQRGFVCDLIACFQGDQRPTSDFSARRIAENLWKNRVVHSSAQGFLDHINGREALKRAI